MLLALASLICAGVAALMAIGQLVLKQRTYKNWINFGLFFNLAVILANSYVYYSGVNLEHPWIFHLHLPSLFMITPLLFIMYKVMLEQQYQISYRTILHFLPTLFATGALLPYYLRTDLDQKRAEFIASLGRADATLPDILFLVAGLWLLGYLLFMLYGLRHIVQPKNLRSEPNSAIVASIILLSLLSVVLLNLTFFTRDTEFMAYCMQVLIVIVITINLLGRRHPEFLAGLQVIVAQERVARSYIKDLDLVKIEAQLQQLMRVEMRYRDDDLTLARLAQLLGISSHQLSQFLNEKLARNFSTYINEFRITEAKDILRSEKDRTILNIAYQVGFNSKSAFNKAFLKIVGKTPSDFRRAQT